jgi:hypothetical protein
MGKYIERSGRVCASVISCDFVYDLQFKTVTFFIEKQL